MSPLAKGRCPKGRGVFRQLQPLYRDKTLRTKMSILNTARMGKFSSDRAIQEYCDEIWNIKPVQIQD
ncbi:glycogen/starch/alpha-glucan phosphorylase [Patescibacteria group bacterium]|nr:glycogen/starch/alpha-glucan phosphorylase [Patescibacteria group bacterium]